MVNWILAMDVGGTKQTVALADGEGQIQVQQRRPTERESGAEGGIEVLLEMAHEVVAEAGLTLTEVARVGIGFGGPVDVRTGTVLLSHHVPGWENVPLRAIMEEKLGLPTVVDNDANAGTLGEARFGAGRGAEDLVYINIGTGIGGGIMVKGQLVRGVTTTAGEIGHTTVKEDGPLCTCGKRGCLESICSGDSIGRRAREAVTAQPNAGRALVEAAGGQVGAITSETVFAVAAQGDALAQALVDETVHYLALAIGNLLNLLNPELVIIGGGLSEVGDILFVPLRQAVREIALEVPYRAAHIVPAELGYEAGILGAVALALE